MSEAACGERAVPRHGREFWSSENLKFSRPHFRMEKVARLVTTIAADREVQQAYLGTE